MTVIPQNDHIYGHVTHLLFNSLGSVRFIYLFLFFESLLSLPILHMLVKKNTVKTVILL